MGIGSRRRWVVSLLGTIVVVTAGSVSLASNTVAPSNAGEVTVTVPGCRLPDPPNPPNTPPGVNPPDPCDHPGKGPNG